MAIKKVKLPNNTVVDINDPRIPGVDSTPTSGSTNVVTSGGVYSNAVTAVGTSGNNLTVTKAGSTSNITVPYATSAGSASSATTATKATQDGNGNTITSYYAEKNHLYHFWETNRDYWQSYRGDRNFKIVTDGAERDTLRFKANTISEIEYWDYTNSAWVAWSGKDISSAFKGQSGSVSIPYNNRKFRFQITASSGWPTTTMFVIKCSWYDSGTQTKIDGTYYTKVTIETRANTSSSFEVKESFGFTNNMMGTCARVLGNLHTGQSYYRITIEFCPWANTQNSITLQQICILSNYSGNLLTPITYDGYGNTSVSGNFTAAKLIKSGGTSSQFLKADGSVDSNTYAKTSQLPAAPGTLNTTATTAQSTSSSEALSGSVTLHKVAKTGTYSDLVGKPTIPSAPGTLNTTATSAQSTSSSEALSGSVTLHKVSKTGSYNDLNNKPTIPSAPGTLITNATTAQTASSGEAMTGSITLHKVSKTGTYSDLVGKPTVDSSPTASSSNLVSSGGVYTALQNIISQIVSFDNVSTNQDGTLIITLSNGDTITVDLNHNHPQYPKYEHLTSESQMPASPDADTMYLIDGGGGGGASIVYLTDESQMPANPDANTLYVILES